MNNKYIIFTCTFGYKKSSINDTNGKKNENEIYKICGWKLYKKYNRYFIAIKILYKYLIQVKKTSYGLVM